MSQVEVNSETGKFQLPLFDIAPRGDSNNFSITVVNDAGDIT